MVHGLCIVVSAFVGMAISYANLKIIFQTMKKKRVSGERTLTIRDDAPIFKLVMRIEVSQSIVLQKFNCILMIRDERVV